MGLTTNSLLEFLQDALQLSHTNLSGSHYIELVLVLFPVLQTLWLPDCPGGMVQSDALVFVSRRHARFARLHPGRAHVALLQLRLDALDAGRGELRVIVVAANATTNTTGRSMSRWFAHQAHGAIFYDGSLRLVLHGRSRIVPVSVSLVGLRRASGGGTLSRVGIKILDVVALDVVQVLNWSHRGRRGQAQAGGAPSRLGGRMLDGRWWRRWQLLLADLVAMRLTVSLRHRLMRRLIEWNQVGPFRACEWRHELLMVIGTGDLA